MGSEEFFNQMLGVLDIIIYRRPKGKEDLGKWKAKPQKK